MNKGIQVIHWLPRIICIIAILFVSMFALDAFAPGPSVWQQIKDFLVHLIPSFLLILLLIIAWKWEYVGGIIFTIIGIGISPLVFIHNYMMNHTSVWTSLFIILMINFPFILVGVLFILNYFIKKKNLPN